MADINSRLPVTDYADGSTGSAAPTEAILVGGSDGTNLRALSTSSAGVLNINLLGMTGSGTITALNGTVTATTAGYGNTIFNITGTWVGTLSVQGTDGDGTWVGIKAYSSANGLYTSQTITSNANILVSNTAWTQIRLIATAYTSGTVSISWSSQPYVAKPQVYQDVAAALLTTTYLNDGSGNSIGSTSGSLNVDVTNTIPVSQSGTWNINNLSGTVSLPTGAATSANQTNASQKTQVVDGSGNVIASYNNQINADDIINTSISSGSITVGTTAVAARVGAANLTNRKQLMISPVTYTIYMGSSSSVTTTTGIPIYPGQVVSFAYSANVTPYLIAATSGSVIVFEGA